MNFHLILMFKKYFMFIGKSSNWIYFSLSFFFCVNRIQKGFFTILKYYLPPHFTFDSYSLQKKKKKKNGKQNHEARKTIDPTFPYRNSRTMESDIDRFRIESQI